MEKKTISKLIIVALGIALIVSFLKISALEQEVDDLRNRHASEVSNLRSEINSIYQNVDNQLKEEASLLSGVKAEFGQLNTDDHTIPVTLTVIPKVVTEDAVLQVSINGRTSELVKSGNEYAGTIPVDLYTEDAQILLTITTAAGTQTQYIQDVYVAGRWQAYIPSFYYSTFTGTATFTEGKYTLNGNVNIQSTPLSDTPGVRFEKYVLVTELNGVEINREDISDAVMNYPNYPDGVYYSQAYQREYEAYEGDELIIRLEATDTLGYLHTMILHNWKEENGTATEAIYGGECIYDQAGNLLYGENDLLK